ncbi:MAG TPA: LapA family protein [Nitrococcus sp.]|nr:LapA family protein [Nitrococcus sp.]
MRRFVDLFAIIIIVVLGLSFAMLNTNVVPLNYYFGTADMPLSLWLTIVLLVGAILGALSTVGLLLRQRAEIVRLRRRAKVEHKVMIAERAKLPASNAT